MRKFVSLDCLLESNDVRHSDVIQNLRRAVLAPITLKPNILDALQRCNFRFHRTSSFYNIVQEYNASDGNTLLMFWGYKTSESKITMSASNTSSLHAIQIPQVTRDKELRSTGQQTDISCRNSSGISSPIPELDDQQQRLLRSCLTSSLTFSSPASSVLSSGAVRSTSILSSVCALLLKQGSTAAPKEVSSVSLTNDHICRICFGGESAERLVRPCDCRGTIAAVHRTCLERWLLQAATSYCELCRHHYVVTRSHKWSWIRSLVEWARSGRGRALLADAWRGAALGAASVLGTARALHACDRVLQIGARSGGGAALAANLFSSLLIGIIGALNGLLTTWMLLKIQEHQMSWQTWRDSTLHVHVTLADEDTVTPTSSTTTVVTEIGDTTDRGTNVTDPFLVASTLAGD